MNCLLHKHNTQGGKKRKTEREREAPAGLTPTLV